MAINPIALVGAGIDPTSDRTVPRSGTSPEKIKKAAEDFEALLIGQMLKSVRESSTGAWGNSDQAGGTALELADQQMAQVLAANGGLGLSRLISAGLEKSQDAPTAPTAD